MAVDSLSGLQDQDMQESVCRVGSQPVFDLSQATVFPMKRLSRVINPVPPNNIEHLTERVLDQNKLELEKQDFPQQYYKGLEASGHS